MFEYAFEYNDHDRVENLNLSMSDERFKCLSGDNL